MIAENLKALAFVCNRGVNQMKTKILRIVFFIIGFLSGIGIVLIAMTYPRYHREMHAAYDRLLTGSKICKTDYGDIEFAVKGEGQPVLLLHGAGGGYDQGFLGLLVWQDEP